MPSELEEETDTAGRPAFNPDSFGGTLLVALALCLACSLLVSMAAVGLRPYQAINRANKMKRNVLIAAGIWKPGKHTDADIPQLFEPIDTILVNFPGRTEDAPPAGTLNATLDPSTYDQRRAASDPQQSVLIPPEKDVAGIKRRPKVGVVYVVRNAQGQPQQLVLPIYGKGLWSTLYGFLAIDANTRVARGITFYEHAETPGLGGEVDNPKWKAQWPQTVLRNEQGDVVLNVAKPGTAGGENVIDGLSGATITSNGVENTIQYWLGDDAYGPFLDRFAKGQIKLPDPKKAPHPQPEAVTAN